MHVFLHFNSFCLVVSKLILASKLSELDQFEIFWDPSFFWLTLYIRERKDINKYMCLLALLSKQKRELSLGVKSIATNLVDIIVLGFWGFFYSLVLFSLLYSIQNHTTLNLLSVYCVLQIFTNRILCCSIFSNILPDLICWVGVLMSGGQWSSFRLFSILVFSVFIILRRLIYLFTRRPASPANLCTVRGGRFI